MTANDLGQVANPSSSFTRRFFADLPVAAARRGPGALLVVSDGHWLSAAGPAAGILAVVALAFGLALGSRHWFFDEVFTESTALVILLATIGVVSTQLGAWTTVGFAVGDFFLFHTTWTLPAPERYEGGLEEVAILAGLWYQRLPLLSQYALLASLCVLAPLGARALASSVQDRIRGPQAFQLFVGAILAGVALFVLVRFWSNAAPHVIRPVFTEVPPWESGRSPPLAAIAPVQDDPAIPRAAAAALFLKFALIGLLPRWDRGRQRVATLEREVSSRVLDLGPRPPTALGSLILQAAGASAFGLLFLAGLIENASTAVAVGGCILAIRLAKSGVLPFPPPRWRLTMSRIPSIVRFALALLVVNGIARSIVLERFGSTQSLELLVWPIVAGLGVMALLFPDPPRPALRPSLPPGPAAASLVGAMIVLAVLTRADPAAGDNCGSLSDCFFSADGAGLALLATLFSMGLDFVPLIGDFKGVVEGIRGRDLITGEELTWYERGLGLMGASELKWLARAGDLAAVARSGDRLSGATGVARRWADHDTVWTAPIAERWSRRPSQRAMPGSGTGAVADWGHVLEGEINGKRITGGHSRTAFESVPGSRVTWEGLPDSRGVYRGSLERARTTSPVPATKDGHTFFPDDWDAQRIQREVDDAFSSSRIDPPFVPGGNALWTGVSPGGVRIEGFVDSAGEIQTAYPVKLGDFQAPPAGVTGRAAQDVTQVPREMGEAITGPHDDQGEER